MIGCSYKKIKSKPAKIKRLDKKTLARSFLAKKDKRFIRKFKERKIKKSGGTGIKEPLFLKALAKNSRTFFFYRFELEPERKFTYVSPSVTKIGGYKPEEFYADPDLIFKIIHPEDRPLLEKLLSSKTLPGKTFSFRCVKKDGQIVWLGHIIVPVKDKSGNIIAVEGGAYDITDQIKIQNEIKESEEKFRVLAETAEAAIFIYQGEKIVYVNPACTKLTGYKAEELLKMKFWEVVHPDFQQLIKERGFARQRGENVPAHYQFKILRKNGEERWVDFTAGLINYKGKPAGIGTAYDITELKRTEENLKRAAEEWRSTFDAIEDLLAVINLQGEVIRCNQTLAKFLKKSAKSLVGQKICDLIHGKNETIKDCPFKKTKKTKKRERCVVNLKQKWFSVTVDPILDDKRKLIGAVHLMRDITNIVKTENELREKEEFLRNVFDSVQDGISILDSNLNIIMTNKAMEKWYSYALPLAGKKCFEAYHRQKEPCKVCPSLKTLQSGQSSYEVVPKRDKKGKIVGWLDLFSFPLVEPESGKIKGVVEYVRDITLRKEAEEKLKQTNRFLSLLSKANEAVVRAASEKELLNQICQLLIGIGKYQLVFICYPKNKSFHLKAKAGKAEGLVELIAKCCLEEGEAKAACSPIKTKKPRVFNNLKSKALNFPWVKPALESNLNSMAVFPLTAENETIGSLCIFASQTDAFLKEELQILQELADDLAFGIQALRAQEERKRIQERLIKTIKKLREEEKRAQELARKTIEVQEKERLYLASEIHDNLLQSLVATYYFLEAIDFPPIHKKVQTQKEEILKVLKSSIAEGRSLLRKIEPLREPEIKIAKAIREAIEVNFASTKIKTHLKCPPDLPKLKKEEKINILRITQEALMNARKHANASNIWVNVSTHKNFIEIEVIDDGKGFDQEKIKKSQLAHFGLMTMEERAKISGGKLFIKSQPGKGTKVKAILPIK